MSKKMVFFHPLPLVENPDSASQLRPIKMIQAFKDIGYEVFEVVGYSPQRKKAMTQLKQKVKAGEKFDFLYGETATTPMMLCDPHHLPLHPFMDLLFLGWFKKNCGPVGVFYRDVHWRFDFYGKHLNFIKKFVAQCFYNFEAYALAKTVDLLFLPTKEMNKHLPPRLRSLPNKELPPGCNPPEIIVRDYSQRPLRLLYVGGVTPPIYDITPMLEMVKNDPELELHLCCREGEWQSVKGKYSHLIADNVNVVHESGEALAEQFKRAHGFISYWQSHDYTSMAAPYKFFEALSYGLPIVASPHMTILSHLSGQKVAYDQLPKSNGDFPTSKEEIQDFAKANLWRDRAAEVSNKL